jgi:hypothetical protein
MSAVALAFVTAFSIEYHADVHNIVAGIFFVVNLWPLYKAPSRFKYYIWIYLISLPVLAYSMLYAELIAIIAICAFHLHSLNTIYKIQKTRPEQKPQ